MNGSVEPRLTRWPFLAGDVLLLCVAALIIFRSPAPLGLWQLSLCATAVALGAAFAVTPFVLEYRAAARLAEANALTGAVARIQQVEQVANQIASATAHWQNAHEAAERTTRTAREIAQKMGAEVAAFTEFMQKMNEGEKGALRLEVEKLRRAENDWLQVLVRILDHVFALHQAGVRSGQPKLVEQLGNFQNACRDAARRIGLVPFIAGPAEPFTAERHQVIDSDPPPAAESLVAETLAAGYTYQGRLLRHALVRLQSEAVPAEGTEAADQPSTAEAPELAAEPSAPRAGQPQLGL